MKTLCFVIMMFLGVSAASAKEFAPYPPAFEFGDDFSTGIGVLFNGKGSIHTDKIEGRTLYPAFGFGDYGISGYAMFGKIGLILDIQSNVYRISSFPSGEDDQISTLSYRYLVFSPTLYLGGFTVGLNFGEASSRYYIDSDDKEEELTVVGAKSIFELVIGGKIGLIDNPSFRMNLDIKGSYALDPMGFGGTKGYNPASFSLGLSFYKVFSNAKAIEK